MPRKSTKKPAKAATATTVIVRTLRARFDAAQTTDDNRRHWANADGFSPNASITPEIRRKLRERCRYEVANNSYAKGIGLTIANDTVGVGPALQMLKEDKKLAEQIETFIWDWMQEIRLPEKLRQLRFAKYEAGEAFAVFGSNPALKSPIKIDCRIFEADQFADPNPTLSSWNEQADGIQYDPAGNPTFYRRLRTHPGSTAWMTLPTAYDDLPAAFVFHYFRADRPGQRRGIPEITPAITDFADLRRFTEATIAAAETAADHAAMIESDAPADPDTSADQEGAGPKVWDLVELQKRAGVVLPSGYKMNQLKAEHPITTYREFVNAKLNEIARCLCVPFHIAAMDPSLANMSSSYVVGQMYTKERLVDRADFEYLLDQGFGLAMQELTLSGLIPPPDTTTHQWNWPSLSHHADPNKEANAAQTKLAAGTTTLAIEYSKQGLDAREQLQGEADLLGITYEEYVSRMLDKRFGPEPAQPADQNQQENQDGNQNQNGNGNAAGRFAGGNGH